MSLRSVGVFVLSLRFPRLCASLHVFACLCAPLHVFARLCMSLRSLGVFVVFRLTAISKLSACFHGKHRYFDFFSINPLILK